MHRTLAEEIDDLKSRVARMTANVQTVVETATQAVFDADLRLAQQAIDADREVDIDEVEVEKIAIGLLARQHPIASDLRYITSVIKMNSDFERIGDCAVNIAQRVPSLERYRKPSNHISQLGTHTLSMLRDTVNAFNLMNSSMAERVLRGDAAIDAYYHQIVQDTLHGLQAPLAERDPSRELAIVMIAKNFERIGDHCTNVAEDILYVTTGRILRHQRA